MIPCSHGLRVITANLKVEPTVYIDEMYYTSTYKKMYDVTKGSNVHIITLDDLYEKISQLNIGNLTLVPPEIEVVRGRKRKKRIESQSVLTQSEKEAKAKRRREQQRKCTICGRSGHVATRCPNRNIAGQNH
jgi:hypothetical protein